MRQEKISFSQLFFVMISFEVGSTVIFGLGAKAKQDAWLAIAVGTMCGFVLMWVYTKLFEYYPGDTLVQMMPKIAGRFLGYPLIVIYIAYFVYLASRVLRDFGELIVGTILIDTPMMVVVGSFMVVIIYCLRSGIEVFGRMGEMIFPALLVVGTLTWIIVYSSQVGFHMEGSIPPHRYIPVRRNGAVYDVLASTK
jgi:spore germination protein KB